MDKNSLRKSLDEYNEKWRQINIAINSCEDGDEKKDLINLRSDIEELISLTEESLREIVVKTNQASSSSSKPDGSIDDEYLLFMKEMEAEGVESNLKKDLIEKTKKDVSEELKALEGMKCQAPHKHTWGDEHYHNALVCGVVESSSNHSFDNIHVRVMFTNPTHQEMLPCPYFLKDSNCKFSEEQCRYSHGETVPFSSLKEYKEPNFEDVKVGYRVLAKNTDKLWHKAIITKINSSNCLIKFESHKKELSVPLMDVLPLGEDDSKHSDDSSSDSESEEEANEWLIQKSLLTTPSSNVLGDWEKHTKGIGSKLMQQMGYVIGTGLGKYADGRINPVDAVVLPSGKSLDHCMNLRELANGDENLFSAERKLKKEQKRQEALSRKAYEREKDKKDVFEFLNKTLSKTVDKKQKNVRQEIKEGSTRDLNVASLKVDEDIRRVENELYKIKESLTRHNNPTSVMHLSLKQKLANKQNELQQLHDFGRKVKTEQDIRKDKKKLTVF